MKKQIDAREEELFEACYEFFNENKRIKDSDIPAAIAQLSAIFLAFSDVETLDLTQREILYHNHLLQILTVALSTNTTLKSLTIQLSNYKQGIDPAIHNAECIASLLRRNNVLTSLSLPMGDIGSKGTDLIFNALNRNCTLTSLNLSGNFVGDDGVAAISICLRVNRTLKSLNLEYNGIKSRVELESLLDAVLNNNTLVELSLKGNRDALFRIISKIDDKLEANRNNINTVAKEGVDIEALAKGMAMGGYRQPIRLSDMDIGDVVGLSGTNHRLFRSLGAQIAPEISPMPNANIQAPLPPVEQQPVVLHEPHHPIVMQKSAGKHVEAQPPLPPQVEQSSNPLNEPSETLTDYLLTFAGQPLLSEQLMALELDDELTKHFEEPINLAFPDKPVRLNGVIHNYDTLLALPTNEKGQRKVPDTDRNFYIIEISPDRDTKTAMLALINQPHLKLQ